MKEYTAKEIKILKANPYTLKVTKYQLSHTAKFKEDFWIRYQAGDSPRKIITDLGYDLTMFGQKRIDSLVQHIKKQAISGDGFTEGSNRKHRCNIKPSSDIMSYNSIEKMQNEILYLRQEVEFLKKILKSNHLKKDK